jgi:hypothetical protein
MVIENECLSRHKKSDLISIRSCIRTLASLTHLVAYKPDRPPIVQFVQIVSRTKPGFQNAITTKPFVEMSHMSNQRKAEFVGDIFGMRSFWKGHGKISLITYFIQVGMICQKYCFSN